MPRSERRSRIVELDVLKGLGVLLMVFDHVGWGLAVHTYIQSFHMPLFFIASGYLSRPCDDLRTFARKRFAALIVPYLCFSMFYLVVSSVLYLLGLQDTKPVNALIAVAFFPTDMSNMPLAPALWFLPCLYLSSVAFAFLDMLGSRVRAVVVLIVAALGISYSSISDVMLPFCLEPLATGLFFLLVGDCLLPKGGQPALVRRMRTGVVILALVLQSALAFLNGSVDMRSARYNNAALYLLVAVVGVLAWWAVSAKISEKADSAFVLLRRSLEGMSIDSLSYLCMNQPAIKFMLVVLGLFLSEDAGLPVKVITKILAFIGAMLLCHVSGSLIRQSPFAFALGGAASKSLPGRKEE